MENEIKELDKKGENSADLAIKQLRVLQQMIYRHDVSDNDLFKSTNEIIKTMEEASKDLNQNFTEISKRLTNYMNGKK